MDKDTHKKRNKGKNINNKSKSTLRKPHRHKAEWEEKKRDTMNVKELSGKTISICIVHVNFFLTHHPALPFSIDSYWPHSSQSFNVFCTKKYIIQEEITDRPNYVTNMRTIEKSDQQNQSKHDTNYTDERMRASEII